MTIAAAMVSMSLISPIRITSGFWRIEARSAERFYLLSEHLEDRELADFFKSLLPSESAHRVMFLRLAEGLFPLEEVEKRTAELRQMEADVISNLPFGARVHPGPKS